MAKAPKEVAVIASEPESNLVEIIQKCVDAADVNDSSPDGKKQAARASVIDMLAAHNITASDEEIDAELETHYAE